MKEKLQEIKEYSKKDIKTMYIVADLSGMTTAKEYEKLAEGLKNVDVGMLILNAGAVNPGPLIDLRP